MTQGAGVLLGLLSFWLQKVWTSAEPRAKPRATVPPNRIDPGTVPPLPSRYSCRNPSTVVVLNKPFCCVHNDIVPNKKSAPLKPDPLEGLDSSPESQLAHKVYLPPSVSTAW
ncbi:MAG: hypothetical protein ACPIOQ_59915, partial [Promethearchaeia archaeon]